MASCPNCGFDLSGSERCANCGSEPPSQVGADGQHGIPKGEPDIPGLVDVETRRLVPPASEVDRSVPNPPIPRRRTNSLHNKKFFVFYGIAAGAVIVAALLTYFLPRVSGASAKRASPPSRAPESSTFPAASRTDLRLPGPEQFIDLWNPPSTGSPVVAHPPTSSEDAYLRWMVTHTRESEAYLRQRWHRAEILRQAKTISSSAVLDAFLTTPREWFCRPYNLSKAYAPVPLPIGYGQVMPSPQLAVRMVSLLDPRPGDRVLEVGTGSGYQSALLAQIVSSVYSVEIVKPLAEETNRLFGLHGQGLPRLADIHRRVADGYYGWKKQAPFDRILVTASIDHIPPDLIDQLKPGGIMVVPVGPPAGQSLLSITKRVDRDGKAALVRTEAPGSSVELLPMTSATGGTHNENQ